MYSVGLVIVYKTIKIPERGSLIAYSTGLLTVYKSIKMSGPREPSSVFFWRNHCIPWEPSSVFYWRNDCIPRESSSVFYWRNHCLNSSMNCADHGRPVAYSTGLIACTKQLYITLSGSVILQVIFMGQKPPATYSSISWDTKTNSDQGLNLYNIQSMEKIKFEQCNQNFAKKIVCRNTKSIVPPPPPQKSNRPPLNDGSV